MAQTAAVPLTPVNSCRNLPKPEISGLSAILLPFFPRRPHRFAVPKSAALSPVRPAGAPLFARLLRAGFGGPSWIWFGVPPRMADTEECGDRACFWKADVMDMHSDITKETGSTATVTGRLRYRIRGARLVSVEGASTSTGCRRAGRESVSLIVSTSRFMFSQARRAVALVGVECLKGK